MFSHWAQGASRQTLGMINAVAAFLPFYFLTDLYLNGRVFPSIREGDPITLYCVYWFLFDICSNGTGHRRTLAEFTFWVSKLFVALTLLCAVLELVAHLGQGAHYTYLLGAIGLVMLRHHYRSQPPLPSYDRPPSGGPRIPTGTEIGRRRARVLF